MIKIHIDFFFHKETREKKYIAFIIFLAYIFPRCVCVCILWLALAILCPE